MKWLFILLALAPSSVLAHPGDHRTAGILHVLSEPDHMALIGVGSAVLGYAVWKLWSRQ